jgi:hypothetical protein
MVIRIGRRNLTRLLGMLEYVNLPQAAKRHSHPYTVDESPWEDQNLIENLGHLTTEASKHKGTWIK